MSVSNRIDLTSWQHKVGDGHIQGYLGRVEENQPTLHFLHGNGFSVKTYLCFLEKLKGYNLIMQDAAGHGESTAGKQFIGWNATASRFVESLDAQRVALPKTELIGMGHSFGGCMTMLMSEQEPTLFDRLVLLDPALFPPRLIWMMRGVKLAGLKSQIPLAKQARRRRTQWESFAQVKSNFFERGTFKGWELACLEDYIASSIKHDEKGHYQLSCPSWMEAAIFSSYPKRLWGAIAKISVPTYIIQGKETFDYFKEAYQLAAKLNPHIQVIEVDGGHCFMQQHSAMAAQAVMEALKNA
ncbi:alpha/beta hydrolase [Marinomonas sp. M1K-6]|uniref:Alpha/beta hydrolase n=1 Tax=Marinomonas profundi TaxID=2726122 RepID=A0A847RBQ8_9GAMM|nr:alpha/beta hydrolase [Marinomonas profundi]NLQ18697.1 alpha/beta hydrolase [Marinomonas profundi]UDV04465.1 alpha/beta hydrolase [Marinomonas profundi]